MRAVVLPDDTDLAGLLPAAGVASYARGRQYAKRRAVLHTEWDEDAGELFGLVQGSGRRTYATTAYFRSEGSGLAFEEGSCSCPMEYDCKHVVALVLTASRSSDTAAPPKPPVTWESSLGELLAAEPAATVGATPLAIQLALVTRQSGHGHQTQLTAAVVRPGKTGWVKGNLSWSQLASPYTANDFRRDHLRVLQEFYALYRARSSYTYYYGQEKALDLATFESANFWTLLDEAVRAGIKLVHTSKALGELPPRGDAEFCLDVTRQDSGELVVRPVLRLDDESVVDAVVFIGAEAHGVVYGLPAETSEDGGGRPIRLAKLVRPVPQQLQRMALAGAVLTVPAGDEGTFNTEYYLRLRTMATVISSDGSYVPPEVSAPCLVLSAKFGDGHELEFEFGWRYQVGDAVVRTSLGPVGPDEPYRDAEQERDVLANLDISLDQVEFSGTGEPLTTSGVLSGIDTMRFATEVLPLLADQQGLDVELIGEPADYREASDSVSIAVSADAGNDPDWFDLGISIMVEGREVPLADVIAALGRHESHVLLPDGAYFSLDKPELQRLRQLVEEAQALQDGPGGLKISRYQAGLWEELASLGVVARQASAWQQQVTGLLEINSVEPTALPATLSATLRPYQRDGFHWLSFLWQHRLGGILADDMGLGKTVQALALICHAKEADPDGAPFLVVAPTSVVPNWAAEAARFAPGLKVAAITQTRRKRGQPLCQVVAEAEADIVVTSYTLFRLDFDDDYADLPWQGLLLDEAQNVKNHQSKTYQAVRRLPAPFKLAITGTPMENNLMELWSQLSIAAPGLFPSPARFQDYYAKPIERWHETELLGQLRQRIKPLVKRRTKELVASELPAKQEQVLEVELHAKHRTVYDRHLQRERQKVLGLIDNMDKNRFTILRSLTLLRQLSLHAGLVDDAHSGIASAKIDVLVEQLEDVVGSGHRALIFSQFTGFLGMVRAKLDAAGIGYCYLDGSTRNRGAVIEEFKTGSAPAFLISLKAGGFGLNLTEADYVFLLDPWWNPATENQAVDRTHRIGQTRNVMVYRLIARDTIEEKVMALKQRKQELFDSVMDDSNTFGTALSADDIRGLFT